MGSSHSCFTTALIFCGMDKRPLVSTTHHWQRMHCGLWVGTSADQACSDTCSDTFIGQSLSYGLFLSTFLELWERLMRSGCVTQTVTRFWNESGLNNTVFSILQITFSDVLHLVCILHVLLNVAIYRKQSDRRREQMQ